LRGEGRALSIENRSFKIIKIKKIVDILTHKV